MLGLALAVVVATEAVAGAGVGVEAGVVATTGTAVVDLTKVLVDVAEPDHWIQLE